MKKKSKIVILLLVFILPVLTFLFLKFFAKNTFEVPVVMESSQIQGCKEFKEETLSDGIDIVFLKRRCKGNDCTDQFDQMKRIAQRYDNLIDLRFTVYSHDSTYVKWEYNNLSIVTTNEFFNGECMPINASENYFLLFDKKNRLRGFYPVRREEVDRLIVELDIINQYQ